VNRRLAIAVAACVLLLVQYLLGMAVNVGVVLPAHHPGAAASNYFSGVASGLGWVILDGPAWVAAHAAFGLALVVAALAAIALTWRAGSRTERALSVLGHQQVLVRTVSLRRGLTIYGHVGDLLALLLALAGLAGGWLVALGERDARTAAGRRERAAARERTAERVRSHT